MQDKAGKMDSVRIQSVVCEDTLRVRRSLLLRPSKQLLLYSKAVQRIITIEVNCCCLSYLVKRGTRSYDLKLNTNLFLFYLKSTNSYFIGKRVTIFCVKSD